MIVAVVWVAIDFLYKRRLLFNSSCLNKWWFKSTKKDEDGQQNNNDSIRLDDGGEGVGQLANKNKKSTRLKSLDTFRG